MTPKLYLRLIEAVAELESELIRTSDNLPQLKKDIQAMYDLINKYEDN